MCVDLFGVFVRFCCGVSCVLFQFLYCSSVVCLYLDVFMGRFRWGLTLGVGKAMLMRGGACAIELCLMVGCVYPSSSGRCWLSQCGVCGCVFLFLMFGIFCIFVGISIYVFMGGCVISIG